MYNFISLHELTNIKKLMGFKGEFEWGSLWNIRLSERRLLILIMN